MQQQKKTAAQQQLYTPAIAIAPHDPHQSTRIRAPAVKQQ
jgi:hypothetical protein